MTAVTGFTPLTDLLARLEAVGVNRPPAVQKIIEKHERFLAYLQTADRTVPDLANASDEEIQQAWRDAAVRHYTPGTEVAGSVVTNALFAAALDALRDAVPTLHKQATRAFAAAAETIGRAARLGIRPGFTAQDVLDLEAADATAAWRDLRPAHSRATEVAQTWIDVCDTVGLGAQVSAAARLVGDRPDWSPYFTEDGERPLSITAPGAFDWLGLAATGAKLVLGDPAKVAARLADRGESPGWIVAAGSVVLTDDKSRQLIIYRGDWVPTWVDADQVTRLVEMGMVTPAAYDAVRPADQYPFVNSEDAGPRRRLHPAPAR